MRLRDGSCGLSLNPATIRTGEARELKCGTSR
jgi:hypothetical protein